MNLKEYDALMDGYMPFKVSDEGLEDKRRNLLNMDNVLSVRVFRSDGKTKLYVKHKSVERGMS